MDTHSFGRKQRLWATSVVVAVAVLIGGYLAYNNSTGASCLPILIGGCVKPGSGSGAVGLILSQIIVNDNDNSTGHTLLADTTYAQPVDLVTTQNTQQVTVSSFNLLVTRSDVSAWNVEFRSFDNAQGAQSGKLYGSTVADSGAVSQLAASTTRKGLFYTATYTFAAPQQLPVGHYVIVITPVQNFKQAPHIVVTRSVPQGAQHALNFNADTGKWETLNLNSNSNRVLVYGITLANTDIGTLFPNNTYALGVKSYGQYTKAAFTFKATSDTTTAATAAPITTLTGFSLNIKGVALPNLPVQLYAKTSDSPIPDNGKIQGTTTATFRGSNNGTAFYSLDAPQRLSSGQNYTLILAPTGTTSMALDAPVVNTAGMNTNQAAVVYDTLNQADYKWITSTDHTFTFDPYIQ